MAAGIPMQAFLKHRPLRTWELRPKGHVQQGMAAGIPKQKSLQGHHKWDLKGMKKQGMAAGIPKK